MKKQNKRKAFFLPFLFLALFVSYVMCGQSVSSAAVRFHYFDDFRWGFVDKYGKVTLWESDIVPLSNISEGLVVFGKKENFPNGGVFDKYGKHWKLNDWVLSGRTIFVDGLALVQDWTKERKYVYVSRNGKRAIKESYSRAEPFSEGLAAVGKRNRKIDAYGDDGLNWRYIDRAGRTVLPGPYSVAGPFTNGVAVVERCSKRPERALIDKKGKILFAASHVAVQDMCGQKGFAVFHKESNANSNLPSCGLLSKDGTIVSKNIRFLNFSEGLGLLGKSPNALRFADRFGQVVVSWPCDRSALYLSDYPRFSEGFAAVPIVKYRVQGGIFYGREMPKYQYSWGFIDKKSKRLNVKVPGGRVIAKALPFSEGISIIQTAIVREAKNAQF